MRVGEPIRPAGSDLHLVLARLAVVAFEPGEMLQTPALLPGARGPIEGNSVMTRISGARRSPNGIHPWGSADGAGAPRHWRTTLAGVVVAAMAMGGMALVGAGPAAADEIVVDQTEVVVETETAEAPPATSEETPGETPGEPPAEGATQLPSDTDTEQEATAEKVDESVEPADEAAPAEPAEISANDDVQLLLVPPGDQVVDKVEICHATAAYKNPYIINEPAADGDVAGHAGHTGPVFYPGIPKGTAWGDIIPPFYYDDGGEEPAYFPGLNWTADGQAIYENDCDAPDVPVPTFEYWVDSCVSEDGQGLIEWELGDLVPGLAYTVEIFDAEGASVDWRYYTDIEGTAFGSASLPPGDYFVVASVYNDELQQWDEFAGVDITIEDCLDVTAAATGCSLGYDGSAVVSLAGLNPGTEYTWVLVGDDYEAGGMLSDEVEGESLEVPFSDLPPGNYVFAIWDDSESGEYAEASFFVEPCPPDITVVVTDCTAAGQDGSATLKLHNLVEGVEYEVRVKDAEGAVYGELMIVVGDSMHMAEVDVSSLPAGRDYVAWVSGEWMPPGGSSEWGPVDSFVLEASADFSLKPCPPAPKPAALAATGTEGTGGLLTAALILFGLGGAALAVRSRRPEGSRTGE